MSSGPVLLKKGQNVGLESPWGFTISSRWTWQDGVDADASVLLLSGGKVRSDADFVFYGQPQSGEGAVRHEGKRLEAGSVLDVMSLALAPLDEAVDSLVIAISLDAGPDVTLNALADLSVVVSADDGVQAASFEAVGAGAETALVMLEIYRRDGAWRVRAVGQGYSDGLAGLARDFGVNIVEAPGDGREASPVAGASRLGDQVDWTRPPVPSGYEL